MKIIKKLSFTLTIAIVSQIFFYGCDSTSSQISLTQISPSSKTITSSQEVSIQVASIGSDLTYKWKVNTENSVSTTVNKWTFGPRSEGVYTIKVWATNSDGGFSNTLESIITVEDAVSKPTASATLSTSYLTSNGSVILTITGSGDNLQYYYNLDSGSDKLMSSNKETISVSGDGNHTIKAWVVNGDDQKSNIVTLSVFIGAFPIHSNINASTFWCGEGASSDNDFITNTVSAWDSHWGEHFGLEDHPTNINRDSDFIPTSSSFTGNENPYYFALPYNDYGSLVYDGDNNTVDTAAVDGYGHKKNAYNVVYWANENTASGWNNKSMCKNRWIKITDQSSGKVCYAQWEDAGPYYYNDHNYVFGTGSPANNTDSPYAGIDLSPSVCLYFGKEMYEWGAPTFKVSWHFVVESEVPNGPWKKHINTQQVYWN